MGLAEYQNDRYEREQEALMLPLGWAECAECGCESPERKMITIGEEFYHSWCAPTCGWPMGLRFCPAYAQADGKPCIEHAVHLSQDKLMRLLADPEPDAELIEEARAELKDATERRDQTIRRAA